MVLRVNIFRDEGTRQRSIIRLVEGGRELRTAERVEALVTAFHLPKSAAAGGLLGPSTMDAEEGGGDAAIRTLGHLFRVTEVFLWDDGLGDVSENSTCHDTLIEDISSGHSSSSVSCSLLDLKMVDDYAEKDLDLANEMNAMGLPTSFKTNKERMRNETTRSKSKGILAKSSLAHEVEEVRVPEVYRLDVQEKILCRVSDDDQCISVNRATVNGEYNATHLNADSTFIQAVLQSDVEQNGKNGGLVKDISQEQENTAENVAPVCYKGEKLNFEHREVSSLEDISGLCCMTESEDMSVGCGSAKCSSDNSRFSVNGVEWGVFWDSFYSRNYYYNFHTQESTWFPPPGLEISVLEFTSTEEHSDLVKEEPCCEKNQQDSLKATLVSQEENNGESSGYTFHDIMSEGNYENVNTISDLNLSLRAGSKNLVEHVKQINFSETGVSTKDSSDVPYCPSDTTDQVDRSTNASTETSSEEKGSSISQTTDVVLISDGLHSHQCVSKRNMKNKVKRIRSNQKRLSGENKGQNSCGAIEGLPAHLAKYWCQRYLLFSKFDCGVKMDEEGWFSVTPEAIARHHASRCGPGLVIDSFSGVGGNAIQFAMKTNHVVAIDIDPKKVDYAQHNATIYGVRNNIEFILGDFFLLSSHLKADTIFLSPPWGGPDYAKVRTYDIQSMVRPHDGRFLFLTAMKIASKIVMFLPRNVDPNQLAELSLLSDPPWELEVEKNYLNGKLKGITAYFCHTSTTSQDAASDQSL